MMGELFLENRAKINDAWLEGLTTGREGKVRAVNPYIGRNPELAKAWDEGYKESTGIDRGKRSL